MDTSSGESNDHLIISQHFGRVLVRSDRWYREGRVRGTDGELRCRWNAADEPENRQQPEA